MALLRVLKGPQKGALLPVFTTPQATVIGRDADVDVPLPDGRASRRHAQIELNRGQWLLTDLQSSNGTIIAGKRIRKVQLREGSTFVIGATELSFHERDIVPPQVEWHGVRVFESLREEGGVFVSRGHQEAMDREVRIDWLHPRRELAPRVRERLGRAQEEARRLQAPGFIPMLHAQVGESGEGTFVILRQSPHATLESRWNEVSRLPPAARVVLFRSVVELLLERAAHEDLRFPVGLCHIAVDLDGEGGARASMPGLDLGPCLSYLTGITPHLSGFVPYLPPEHQGEPEDAESPPLASVMYNAGALGYHLLGGQPPMGTGDVARVLENHRALRPAPASLLDPSLPRPLSDLLERMLEKEPVKRPVGRAEIIDVLERSRGEWSRGAVLPPPAPLRRPAAEPRAPAPAPPPARPAPPARGGAPPRRARPPAATAAKPAAAAPSPRRSPLASLPIWVVVWIGLFFAARVAYKWLSASIRESF
jgi:hypothetical protein